MLNIANEMGKIKIKKFIFHFLYIKEEMRKTMTKPMVSKDFNLEDIRKIREYNSLRHIKMTPEEIIEDNRKGAAVVLELLQQTGKVDIG
ncbi:hypothetical protein D3Z50_17190 [Clostridiaceae bacterium]|nr:hypothetical protein [Clostridiaceae bacterium]